MKICVIILTLASAIFARLHSNHAQIRACQRLSRLNGTVIAQVFRGSDAYEENTRVHCFLKCLLLVDGLVDNDGNFRVTEFETKAKQYRLSNSATNNIIACVLSDSAQTSCFKGYQTFKCINFPTRRHVIKEKFRNVILRRQPPWQ